MEPGGHFGTQTGGSSVRETGLDVKGLVIHREQEEHEHDREMLVDRHRQSEEVERRDRSVLSGGRVGLRMGAATVTLLYSHEQTTTQQDHLTTDFY